jgi:hypothetical protein
MESGGRVVIRMECSFAGSARVGDDYPADRLPVVEVEHGSAKDDGAFDV